MTEQESIAEYVGRLQVLTNSMKACDKLVKCNKVVAKILWTLTPQFNHMIVVIEESKDLEKMFVEELQNSLEAHEHRILRERIRKKVLIKHSKPKLIIKDLKVVIVEEEEQDLGVEKMENFLSN